MMNISKETVDFLIYNELSYSSDGGFLRIKNSLKNLVMLGGSPEMLMFCLVNNISESDDPNASGSIYALKYLFNESYRNDNWITSLGHYDKPDKKWVTLERFNTKNLLNVTLTYNVFNLFKHNKDTLFFEKDSLVREGMSILDFLLVKREQIANKSSDNDEKPEEMIQSVDALIDLFVENGAKPTPKLLLHTLKQGKDCSVLEGQLNKMKCA